MREITFGILVILYYKKPKLPETNIYYKAQPSAKDEAQPGPKREIQKGPSKKKAQKEEGMSSRAPPRVAHNGLRVNLPRCGLNHYFNSKIDPTR